MLSPEARGFLLTNPDEFILHYFSHRIRKLEDFHLRLIQTATTEPRGLILYPAAHGKTTLVSTLLPIWESCRDPNVRIGIIGKNDTEANNISLSIQAELMSNDQLMRDFGPFRPEEDGKPWALGKMSVAKRTLIAKEPTFAFFGAGSKHVLGHRANKTICDDVVTQQNSNTPEQRAKIKEWFNQSVRTMTLPGGQLTVVGTLFDPADLYCDLRDMRNPETGEFVWTVQREDAIVDEEARLPLWPEWWPWKSLMELKAEMGTLDFNKRLRNIAVDKSRMVFKEEYIKGQWANGVKYPGCLDREHIVGEYDPSWRRVSGFDPAVGITRSAKFCAHIVLALGSCRQHDRCVWVVDLLRDQLSLPQQVDAILERHQRYDLLKSVVEANSYQAGLLEALKRRMDEAGLAFRIEPHYTTRTNKPDPELGVQSMSPWFENGWVHIPQGNPESLRKMSILVDELIEYPGRTTDTVMAFWFAWKQLQESAPKYKASSYLKNQNLLGFGRPPGRRIIRNPYYERAEA